MIQGIKNGFYVKMIKNNKNNIKLTCLFIIKQQ